MWLLLLWFDQPTAVACHELAMTADRCRRMMWLGYEYSAFLNGGRLLVLSVRRGSER